MSSEDDHDVRLATAADLDIIQNCAAAAYSIYVAAIGRKPAPMVADFASLIAQNLVWISSPNGFIVMYSVGTALHIENVAVHPSAQGQGIGGRLMSFAKQHARFLGLNRIELYTNAKMDGPLALYPKLGFVKIDQRIEDGFERVYFAKQLT